MEKRMDGHCSTGQSSQWAVEPMEQDLSDLKTQFVPRSKLSASVLKPDKLRLYREIIAVCSEIRTKHINALWAEHKISEC